jgi:rubrerythrin
MDAQRQDALSALEMAIQIEVEGNQFYTKAAETVTWPEGKQMLLELADDEMEHIRILKEEHAALLSGKDWISAAAVAPAIESGERKPMPVFERDEAKIAGMVDDRADALEVLDVAIKNEYKSHTFYAEQKEKTDNPEAKKIFDWLVKEEKNHQAVLTDYARYIGAHGEWLLEHERPILES